MQFSRLFSYSALSRPAQTAVRARMMCTAAAAPAKIPMSLIQELRNRTGAGVTDCKKALEANKADIAMATSWLREKGKTTATKLSSRVAAEGVVALAYNGGNGVIVEMNSETDFVARGVSFKSLAHKIVDHSVSANEIIPKGKIDTLSIDSLKKIQIEVENDEPGQPPIKIPVEEAITRTITKTKENVHIRRAYGIATDKGVVGGYIHGGEGDTKAGKIGALVTVTGEGVEPKELTNLANQLAMHIVGLNPKCIDASSPILKEELTKIQATKPNTTEADIIEDVVLLEQKLFGGSGETVKEALEKTGAKVDGFLRLVVGEGIEKKETDFADEVMGMVKS